MSRKADEGSSVPKVKIWVMGKEYKVPSSFTIMTAMEYIGYRFKQGIGCRNGYCGACATFYRVKGDYKLRPALACQEIVKDGMVIVQIPFVPAKKTIYDIDKLEPSANAIFENYPEVARCLSCNTCTKACPQNLEVMEYVQAALRGDLEKVMHLSFECVECGLCAMRCPAEIKPYLVARLARRLYAKYMVPLDKRVRKREEEIKEGKFDKELERLMKMSVERLKELYEERRLS